MDVKSIVEKIIKKHKSRDPFEIAHSRNIRIIIRDLGEVKGFYLYYKRKQTIYISSLLSEHEQKVVCCHELGHAILHPRLNVFFLESNTYFTKNKFECEANRFAAELLIDDTGTVEYFRAGLTLEQIANVIGVPHELLCVKYGEQNTYERID